jgi:hypothetical protein
MFFESWLCRFSRQVEAKNAVFENRNASVLQGYVRSGSAEKRVLQPGLTRKVVNTNNSQRRDASCKF